MNDTPHQSSQDTGVQTPDDFDARLHALLHAVPAPPGLQERLLALPQQLHTPTEAANEPVWRRLLPAAAALLLAIGIGLYYQPDLNAALADEIFSHIYVEEAYYGDGSALPLAEVNARLAAVSTEPLDSADAAQLAVSFAKDCYVAKQRTMHLVIKGSTGPVNVMMIPAQVVEDEVRIADERFSGLVTPGSAGTLVVVGNKQEPLAHTRDIVASSLHWQY